MSRQRDGEVAKRVGDPRGLSTWKYSRRVIGAALHEALTFSKEQLAVGAATAVVVYVISRNEDEPVLITLATLAGLFLLAFLWYLATTPAAAARGFAEQAEGELATQLKRKDDELREIQEDLKAVSADADVTRPKRLLIDQLRKGRAVTPVLITVAVKEGDDAQAELQRQRDEMDQWAKETRDIIDQEVPHHGPEFRSDVALPYGILLDPPPLTYKMLAGHHSDLLTGLREIIKQL